MLHSSPSAVYASTTYIEQIVKQIPTLFGRLVYVAALWNPASNCYNYNPLNQLASRATLDSVLGRMHLEIFRQFLSLELSQQRRDLMRYADSDEPEFESVIKIWRHQTMLNRLAPLSAMAHERQLFVSEFILLMETLPCPGV